MGVYSLPRDIGLKNQDGDSFYCNYCVGSIITKVCMSICPFTIIIASLVI